MNLSLGGKWSSVAKALKNRKFFTAVARIGTKLNGVNGKDLEDARNGLHYLYNAYDMKGMDSTPKFISFDIPVGVGVEASIAMSYGKIEIY